jgi:hypothetical protein
MRPALDAARDAVAQAPGGARCAATYSSE